jgi:hypothetical protein
MIDLSYSLFGSKWSIDVDFLIRSIATFFPQALAIGGSDML